MSVNTSISSPSPPTSPSQTNTTLSPLPSPPSEKIKSLFEIISTHPYITLEKSLDDSCIDVTPQDIEHVLKISYRFPAQAIKFFYWAGHRINYNYTSYSLNLVVDILGKNRLFDAMWDMVKSMSLQGLLSQSTFASIFASYVNVGRIVDAITTFHRMDGYGCVRDVVSLNSLLSVICRSGRVIEASSYLQIVKELVRPDFQTYAILMEGLESDGNVIGAREIFSEMIFETGWDPNNVLAYDSFLCTLIKGDGILEAVKFFDLLRHRRCYPGIRFFSIALDMCVRFHDIRRAEFFWEVMLGNTQLQPTTAEYKSMIALYCYHGDIDDAVNMLNGMLFKGAIPDWHTYNLVFGVLIERRKSQEASRVFSQMVKDKCVPDQINCDAAIRVYLDNRNFVMAIRVWEYLVENYHEDLEGTANLLVVGLRDNDRVPEAVKYAEKIIGRGIKLTPSTLSKLRQSLVEERKEFVYEELVAKWKAAY